MPQCHTDIRNCCCRIHTLHCYWDCYWHEQCLSLRIFYTYFEYTPQYLNIEHYRVCDQLPVDSGSGFDSGTDIDIDSWKWTLHYSLKWERGQGAHAMTGKEMKIDSMCTAGAMEITVPELELELVADLRLLLIEIRAPN